MQEAENHNQALDSRVSFISARNTALHQYRIGNQPFAVATNKKYLLIKRAADVLFSILIILGVLSWLIPILAILIKLDSRGPVFFSQKRIGLNGKSFRCFKLRTMFHCIELEEIPACINDQRITRIGRLLRKTNLDELPQFLNVLAGEMSIVGPRPHMNTDCIRFSFVIPSYRFRHLVKPGITGLAQVKGYHGPAPDYESIIQRFYWDAEYIRKVGILLDVNIIIQTAGMSLKNILLARKKKNVPLTS